MSSVDLFTRPFTSIVSAQNEVELRVPEVLSFDVRAIRNADDGKEKNSINGKKSKTLKMPLALIS